MALAQIETVSDFVGAVLDLDTPDSDLVFFRGHDNSLYKNTPGVFRTKNLFSNEDKMLRDLISLHPEEFYSDKTALEQIVRAQHYSLPTRLLDITKKPLAALYFACCKGFDNNGEVVVFTISKARVKRYDSDTVSCIANLAFLSISEKRDLNKRVRKIVRDRKISDHDEIRIFRNSREVQRLYHFICQEKPYFKNEFSPSVFGHHIAVLPKLSNQRISAQSGAFIVFGIMSELKEDSSKLFKIERLSIPATAKEKILIELNHLDVNEHTLFPEIEHSAYYIKQSAS